MQRNAFVLALLALFFAAPSASAEVTPEKPAVLGWYGYRTLSAYLFLPCYLFAAHEAHLVAHRKPFTGEYRATKNEQRQILVFSVFGGVRAQRAFSISPTARFFGKEKTLGFGGMW